MQCFVQVLRLGEGHRHHHDEARHSGRQVHPPVQGLRPKAHPDRRSGQRDGRRQGDSPRSRRQLRLVQDCRHHRRGLCPDLGLREGEGRQEQVGVVQGEAGLHPPGSDSGEQHRRFQRHVALQASQDHRHPLLGARLALLQAGQVERDSSPSPGGL